MDVPLLRLLARKESFLLFQKHIKNRSQQVDKPHGNGLTVSYTLTHSTAEKLTWLIGYLYFALCCCNTLQCQQLHGDNKLFYI